MTDESTAREAERFRRESRIGAALSYPKLVDLIDSAETRGRQLYAVFVHVAGEALEQVPSPEEPAVASGSGRLGVDLFCQLAILGDIPPPNREK